MINRENYLLVCAYNDYLGNVQQLDEGTLKMYWQGLKHLLQWADKQTFKYAHKIMPSFPEYLLTARNVRHTNDKDTGKQLTPKYMKKILGESRAFFNWLRLNERGYNTVTEAWIETLKVRRSVDTQSRLQERHYWRLEDVRKVIALNPTCIRERRDLAAFAFLMLSGMRIGAFVTLPVDCVDIKTRKIQQLPEKGVQTKNSKAAVTFLLPIADIHEIVSEWDIYIRTLKGSYNWYPPMDHAGETLLPGLLKGQYTGRAESFKQGLKQLCDRAGVAYKSPHKIRHGHGVYGVKKSKDIAQLKAISQNLMHANIGITDGIYGNLAEDDLAEILKNFGN